MASLSMVSPARRSANSGSNSTTRKSGSSRKHVPVSSTWHRLTRFAKLANKCSYSPKTTRSRNTTYRNPLQCKSSNRLVLLQVGMRIQLPLLLVLGDPKIPFRRHTSRMYRLHQYFEIHAQAIRQRGHLDQERLV
jgi:hypothetical protein